MPNREQSAQLTNLAREAIPNLESLLSDAAGIALNFEQARTRSMVDSKTGSLIGPRGYRLSAVSPVERISRDMDYVAMILIDMAASPIMTL